MATWDWPVAVVSAAAYDGDTVQIDVDLGRGLFWRPGHSNIRLAGINAPELGTATGSESRDYLRSLIPVGTQVRLASVGYDKYRDRCDAIITRLPDGLNVNDDMVASGHAVPLP